MAQQLFRTLNSEASIATFGHWLWQTKQSGLPVTLYVDEHNFSHVFGGNVLLWQAWLEAFGIATRLLLQDQLPLIGGPLILIDHLCPTPIKHRANVLRVQTEQRQVPAGPVARGILVEFSDYFLKLHGGAAAVIWLPIMWRLPAPENPLLSKTYDIVFVGALSQRRVNLLQQLQGKGFQVETVGGYEYFESSLRNLLAHAKILLNFGYNERRTSLETHRICQTAGLDIVVVSEKSLDVAMEAAFAPVLHIFEDVAALPAILRQYLEEPGEAWAAKVATAKQFWATEQAAIRRFLLDMYPKETENLPYVEPAPPPSMQLMKKRR